MKKELLDTFTNPNPDRDYRIEIKIPEFTSVCPKTGQPDYGLITINYIPDQLCLELKALKFYIQAYRNEGIFYESLINKILDDLSSVSSPRKMTIQGAFTPRGGISTIVEASL